MVAAGIVTVVSGGNLGKTDEYPMIWGGITSPGTDPTVITVSPINTKGTFTLTDDIATSYGSRFKPDISASRRLSSPSGMELLDDFTLELLGIRGRQHRQSAVVLGRETQKPLVKAKRKLNIQ